MRDDSATSGVDLIMIDGLANAGSPHRGDRRSLGSENTSQQRESKSKDKTATRAKATDKMSAVADSGDGPIEVLQVLFALHPSFGAQE